MKQNGERKRGKKYAGGGVILVLKNNHKEYIVLVKRSSDAKHNPDMYSAFFGWADKHDANNPLFTAARELNEEILIVNHERNRTYALVLPETTFRYATKITKEGMRLWKKEKGISIPDRIEPLPAKILKTIEYIEDIGRIKRFVVQAEIKNPIGDIIFFDCETKHENPGRVLLDRRIDLFELQTFQRWWLEGGLGSVIKAAVSFRGGKRIKPCKLIRAQDNLSPSFVFALNKWWGTGK